VVFVLIFFFVNFVVTKTGFRVGEAALTCILYHASCIIFTTSDKVVGSGLEISV
jgi:hypothetical protein